MGNKTTEVLLRWVNLKDGTAVHLYKDLEVLAILGFHPGDGNLNLVEVETTFSNLILNQMTNQGLLTAIGESRVYSIRGSSFILSEGVCEVLPCNEKYPEYPELHASDFKFIPPDERATEFLAQKIRDLRIAISRLTSGETEMDITEMVRGLEIKLKITTEYFQDLGGIL